ncbi:MAG: phosphoribosylanthranilate isomerase [Ignavibacteriae bacterium]|nr:phosphoribosylanthranilate isomerase [Ignavibacteriota bacterium]
MRPQVKICGITNLDDALFCTQVGANALGFIFYKKSPRYIEPSTAAKIIEELPGYISPVGVFVNEQRKVIEQIVSETGIRIIQLSGDESPDDCLRFKTRVWKAFRLFDLEEVKQIKRYKIAAAMLEGASGTLYGGSGILPDYAVALEMKEYHPVILSGGLKPENVTEAVRLVEPYAIDVNSGLEASPGKKDHIKVKLLFEKLEHLK